MGTHAKILYSGFWDRPLGFVVQYATVRLFFSREFDEELDDYQAAYQVFLLPNMSDKEVQESWVDLRQKAEAYICTIPMNSVVFDSSFRESIDTDILDAISQVIRTRQNS